jgi:hypothetical protein
MSNKEATAELRSRLDALPIAELSASTIGHANYAWLNETRHEKPFGTPDAASQMYALLRKGNTIGEMNQERMTPFLEMLATEADPAATVQQWSLRNGHEPMAAGRGGKNISEPTPSPEPSVEPVTEIPESLRALLAPLQARYELLEEEVAKRQAYLDEAKSELTTLRQMLKTAGVIEKAVYRKSEPESKPRKQAKGSHVSDETAQNILEQIRGFVASNPPALEDVPGSFTRPMIEKGIGLHHSQVGAAVEKLREQGYIRAAGLTTAPGGQKTNVFAVVA